MPTPSEETWIKEWEDKWEQMLEHRLYHYMLQHYRDIGREATKKEEHDTYEIAQIEVNRLKAFISRTLKEREATVRQEGKNERLEAIKAQLRISREDAKKDIHDVDRAVAAINGDGFDMRDAINIQYLGRYQAFDDLLAALSTGNEEGEKEV